MRSRLPDGPLGLSGQMHGLVVLGEDGEVLRPAILWNDGRTGAECAEIEARVGLDRLIALTGNRALAGFTAPKLLWLRRHEPEVYARIRHVLLPKDYVRFRLTGERAIDAADASGTLLFDVAEPALVGGGLRGAGDPARVAARRRTSRPRSRARATRPRPRSASASTGRAPCRSCSARRAWSSRRCPRYEPDREARVHVFCHAVPGTWHAMGVMLSAAGSFGWLRDVLGAPVGELDAEAERWQPGTEGLLFAPYLAGERTPHADPDARGAFVGLSLRHDRGALARAVMEGVAYGLRDSLELLRELGVAALGRPARRRRRAQRAVDADRRLGARPAARAHRDRRGLGVRRRAARGCPRRASSRTRPTRSRAASASRRASSPTRRGSRPTPTATTASAPCIRH